MKKLFSNLFFVTLLVTKISAQNHVNLGFGLGFTNPLGVNHTIFINNSSHSKIAMEFEKGITPKGAFQTGIQFSMLSMSMDAILNANNHLAVAPDSIKYAAINQMSIQIPLRYRFYNSEEKDGKFYQVGVTLGYSFNNIYTFRNKNQDKEQAISNVNPFQCLIHIGLGSRIRKKHIGYIDLSIPITPYFNQTQASSLYPLQISYNLLL